MPVIGSGFGDGIHKPGIGASYFSIKTAADNLELSHCSQRKEEDRIVTAALVALQWVVEVGAVKRDVRIDGPLTGNHQAVTVRFLVDVRRELHKVRESTTANRRRSNRSQIDTGRTGNIMRVNGAISIHHHGLGLDGRF